MKKSSKEEKFASEGVLNGEAPMADDGEEEKKEEEKAPPPPREERIKLPEYVKSHEDRRLFMQAIKKFPHAERRKTIHRMQSKMEQEEDPQEGRNIEFLAREAKRQARDKRVAEYNSDEDKKQHPNKRPMLKKRTPIDTLKKLDKYINKQEKEKAIRGLKKRAGRGFKSKGRYRRK